MTKLWISHTLELRHSEKGWPKAATEEYAGTDMAIAKEESILVVDIPVGFLIDRLPNTFVEINGDIEVVYQWKWLDGWRDYESGDDYNQRILNSNKTRKIARLVGVENSAHGYTEGSEVQ